MNSLVTILVLILLFNLYAKRWKLKRTDLYLLILGAALPLVDYWVAFNRNEATLSLAPQFFHSLIYQLAIWSLLALLHWVYFRNPKRALQLYRPLGGLALYGVFTLFSTEERDFFHPFSEASYSLGWVVTGYVMPLVLLGLVFLTRKLTGLEKKQKLYRTYLLVLVGFVFLQGGIKGIIYLTMPESFRGPGQLAIQPLNLAQYTWNVTLQYKGNYLASHFSLIGGFDNEPERIAISNEPEILISQLMEPEFQRLFFQDFHAPMVELRFQHENLEIMITEMEPRQELIWVEKVTIFKNRMGQNLEIVPQYGSLF